MRELFESEGRGEKERGDGSGSISTRLIELPRGLFDHLPRRFSIATASTDRAAVEGSPILSNGTVKGKKHDGKTRSKGGRDRKERRVLLLSFDASRLDFPSLRGVSSRLFFFFQKPAPLSLLSSDETLLEDEGFLLRRKRWKEMTLPLSKLWGRGGRGGRRSGKQFLSPNSLSASAPHLSLPPSLLPQPSSAQHPPQSYRLCISEIIPAKNFSPGSVEGK